VALPQAAVMASIVATLLYWPAGVTLALVLGAFGVPLDTVVSFGGSFNRLVGLFAWWLLAFAIACVYIACAFPWEERVLKWPKKK
jgi:Zn-dependent protease